METISTQAAMARRENQSVLGDKDFLLKISALGLMIVVLASYVVFQGFSTVDKLSFSQLQHDKTLSPKLQHVETNINGNAVDLEIKAADFEGVENLSLSEIEKMDRSESLVTQKSGTKLVSAQVATPKKKIFISSQSVGSLSLIKKKFYATHNISFSLLLAEKFYGQKAYKKALKWALISNEIDGNNERSWLLFAKSKAKLGKKQDALNALEVYFKSHPSVKVKKAFADIEKTI